jgi:O-antigen/teichoic acid export membrane protein
MPAGPAAVTAQPKSFVHNVLWSWFGIIVGLLSGLVLSPFVIHRLGDERYGIWALAFSLIDYYALVDFGFRSAVIKYAAQYRATGELDRLDELIATGLVYFSIAAVVVAGVSFLVANNVNRLFHTSARDESAFRFLAMIVGTTFALGVIFSVCSAVLEAYQRFDITSRILIVNNGVRVTGCFVVIFLGFGLKAMGLCVLAANFTAYGLTYRALHRILPGRSFSPRKASRFALRQMLGYGSHTFMANSSLMVLNQDAPVLIGHFLTATMVGYYTFPLRLLSYSADLVNRIGMVTGSKAAELTAYGDIKGVSRMAVLVNRYCLTLFLPLAVYLAIFGRQLLQRWINPEFAAHGAPLLPVLGAGVVIGIAAQFNSTSVLYGLAKHAAMARALLLEAILSVTGLWYVTPRYGIFSAACVVSGLMIVVRGLFVPYSLSHHIGMTYRSYLWRIYSRPVAIMTPVAATAWYFNRMAGEPATWRAVLGSGAAMAFCYYGLVLFFGLESSHRLAIAGWAAKSLPPFARKLLPLEAVSS